MKTTKKDRFPLHQPLRVWAEHTGFSTSKLCRGLKAAGIHLNKRKEKGATLKELIEADALWPLCSRYKVNVSCAWCRTLPVERVGDLCESCRAEVERP